MIFGNFRPPEFNSEAISVFSLQAPLACSIVSLPDMPDR